MKCDLTYEEARDEKIAELTEQHARARMAMLRIGDKPTVSAVASSVSAEFNDDRLMDELVELAVRDPHAMQARFEALVSKVVRDEAEADAVREVEQIESDRKQEADEGRVSVAMYE